MLLVISASPFWFYSNFPPPPLAAFDTIDHAMLLERLGFLYGFFNLVLQWFTSYLVDRPKRIMFDKFSFPASSFILWSPSRLHFRTGVIFSLYFSTGGCSYSSRLTSNDVRRRFSALHYYETKKSCYSIKRSYALYPRYHVLECL